VGQHVIELNGKRYDALSGKYLGKAHVVPQHILHGKVIDGFVRPTPVAKPELPAKAPTVQAKPAEQATAAPVKAAAVRRHAAPHHAKAHQPEHSKTLMRRAVHKPEASLKPIIKAQAPVEITAKPKSPLMRRSVASVDTDRLQRAAHIGKHQTIRHFVPLDRPVATHTVVAEVPVISVRSAPHVVTHAAEQAKHHDSFEAAIAQATSHHQPAHVPRKHRSRRRMINAVAIVAAFVVIGGFVTYLNLPNIELHVASIQTGFHASIPGYTPTGYALEGGIKRAGGTVSLSFRSGDSGYTITQQASNWNSQTLLDNTLALGGSHDTIEKDGQTIYLYGHGANASWVNGGIRYDVTGNAQLSKDDIAAIATSL